MLIPTKKERRKHALAICNLANADLCLPLSMS